MIALISPAKTMRSTGGVVSFEDTTEPRFMEHTRHIATLMMRYNTEQLSEIFKISDALARELRVRFDGFFEESMPSVAAVESYDGVVYKHFKGEFSLREQNYLQSHVRISSLMYGLLRPLDRVRPYRMEGFVRMAGSDERVDRYWRNIQTSVLIADVQASGGELLYLASKQEQDAFNWREVRAAVRVIDIQFLVQKGDKLRQVVIYTKMARGEMLRYMLENNITDPEHLKAFEWSGYRYVESLSNSERWVWVME
ncbi:MAG: YaaA family protein [Rikenellaceae bacterium]